MMRSRLMTNFIKCRGRSMGYAPIYVFYSTYVLCSLCGLVDLTISLFFATTMLGGMSVYILS